MTRTAHVRRCRWCAGPQLHDGSVTARILDLLEDDDGRWWTARQIADRTNRQLPSVRRSLADLRAAGLVFATRARRMDPYQYRAKSRPKMRDRSWPPTVTNGLMCSCGTFLPNPHRLPTHHVLSGHHEEHVHPERRPA